MWRLRCDRGRQWWDFDSSVNAEGTFESELKTIEAERNAFSASRHETAHSSDGILRAQAAAGAIEGNPTNGCIVSIPENLAASGDKTAVAIHKGIAYYATLQMGDGHWAGDYGGPMFLLPGLIIACRITGTDLGKERVSEMLRYLRNHQRKDGGFGLHIEHHSTMFGTALSYVSMRLLGLGQDDPACIAARAWIEKHGGAGGIPGWGKFWLAVLGVYEWDGMDPLTPEFWLLPYALPVHPARFWCHCRVVYLPMSYLYGRRAVGPIDELVLEIREELYGKPYRLVNWDEFRGCCCPVDVYVARPQIQRLLWNTLTLFEKFYFPGKESLRRWALAETLELIKSEDENTNYICIGPVNKTINFLCAWFDDPKSPAVRKHADRVKDYLWIAEDGMKMQGYNGSQLWDTALSAQALVSAGRDLLEPFLKTMTLAYDYVNISQVRVNVPNKERYYRHESKGAWPFSTVDHGWPISDCTGEGLKAALVLDHAGWIPKLSQISTDRLEDAVDMILSYQNQDGGWATYELTRGPRWLEYLNPSEIFGDIMIDYSYCECSSSSITALCEFRDRYPSYRRGEVDLAVSRGVSYIKSIQKADGSWYGSWGVCFLYGTWFSVTALVAAGETAQNSISVMRACEFVLSVQRSDGSWGESYRSSQDKVYSQSQEGQVVQTSWAILVLTLAKWSDGDPIKRGAEFLTAAQMDSGDWPQQLICGVFNKNCMISYSQYRNIFPIWGLAESRRFLNSLSSTANG